jgi:hypothetical protein
MSGISRDDLAARTRRTIIDFARRRQLPGTGSNLERDEGEKRIWPDLTGVLGDIPWAVAGAVAARHYAPERATSDLDVVVMARDAATARERMAAAGYAPAGELAIGGSSWRSPDGILIDVIESTDAWMPGAIAAAAANRDWQGLPVLPLAYLVLMKLIAGRSIDAGDITRLTGYAGEDELVSVRAVVAAHAPELSDDLESFVTLGKLEHAPDEPR